MSNDAILLSDVADLNKPCRDYFKSKGDKRHLPPKARIVLRDLIDCGACTEKRLIDQLWGHLEDGGPETANRLLRLYIFYIRRVLYPNWQIINHRYWGYSLVYTYPKDAT